MNIKREVRQEYVMCPLFFNVYSESIFKKALLSENEGITINGNAINNIRFAKKSDYSKLR